MKSKTTWLIVSCLIIVALLIASCTPVVNEKEGPSTPTKPEQPLTTDQLPEITLDDAVTILNVHSILPNSFGHMAQVGEASVSALLDIGKSVMFIEGQLPSLSAEGEVIESRPWCEIQGVLWIVDSDTAQRVSVADALGEYGLDGYPVDLGMSAEALLHGGDGSGLDFLMIKYGRVFVVLISWYSHPRDNYVSLVDLGQVIVERLSEYAQ